MLNNQQLSNTVLIHLWNYRNHVNNEIKLRRALNTQDDDYFEQQDNDGYQQHLKEVLLSLHKILNGFVPHEKS